MKIKVLTVNGQILTLMVSEYSYVAMERYLDTDEPAGSGRILCTYQETGWPVVLNLLQCVTVERAPS